MLRVLAGTATALFLLTLAAPALAQEDGQSIKGKMEFIDGDVRDPVEGVEVVVTQGGAPLCPGLTCSGPFGANVASPRH